MLPEDGLVIIGTLAVLVCMVLECLIFSCLVMETIEYFWDVHFTSIVIQCQGIDSDADGFPDFSTFYLLS